MAEKVKKPFYKKWWFWLIIVVVVIFAFSGGEEATNTEEANSDNIAPNEVNNQDETKQSEETFNGEPQQEEDAEEYGIGEEVTVGNLTYTVNNVEEMNELTMEFMDPLTTEGKFVVVDLSITNNDQEARFVDSEMFRIIGSDGVEYSSNTEADMYVNDDIGFFLSEVNPKMTGTGKVVFEIPADETDYVLQVSSGFGWSGGEYATINLDD